MSIFNTYTVHTDSVQKDAEKTVPESRAIQKREAKKSLAARLDLKRYAALGPIAASLLVIAVLGLAAVLDKFSKRKAALPRSSVTRPLGTTMIPRPPTRTVKRTVKVVRASQTTPQSTSSSELRFDDESLPTFDGAESPFLLEGLERDRLERQLRETLIEEGRIQTSKPLSVDDLRTRLESTASSIIRFVND